MLHEQVVGNQEFSERLVAFEQRLPHFGAHGQPAYGTPVSGWLVKATAPKWVGGTSQDAWMMREQRFHSPLLAIRLILAYMPENQVYPRLAWSHEQIGEKTGAENKGIARGATLDAGRMRLVPRLPLLDHWASRIRRP